MCSSIVDPTIIAVDWSGARIGAQRHIWLAEAENGVIRRLENGRGAEALAQELIETALRKPNLVVGLDFAFSFPVWFLDQLGTATAHELWQLAECDGEMWLEGCRPPFWGRPGKARPIEPSGPGLRGSEILIGGEFGFRPKSVFQIGGAGSVGTGSIRGMKVLKRLHQAGFSVWPFDPPELPVVIEIYPRLLTGPVIKSNPLKRLDYLIQHFPEAPSAWTSKAVASEDAFDAAVSAMVMSRHAQPLASLDQIDDPEIRREGQIWWPGL